MFSGVEGISGAPHSRTSGWTYERDGLGDGPSGFRVVAADTPSCAELRDLVSLRRDIELAEVYVSAYAAVDLEAIRSARDPQLGLWQAAIVSYGRAFGTGVRRATIAIDDLTADEKTAHDYYLGLRNKHVAHAVNEYEQAVVLAFLTNSAFAHRGISRIGHTSMELLPIDKDEVAALRALCRHHVKQLNRRMATLRAAVQRELWAMGESAVYALPSVVMPDGDRSRVARRRR